MKSHGHRLAVAASALIMMGCASHPSSPPAPPPSPARCQAISDSVAAQTNTDSLPEGGFQRRFNGAGAPTGLRKDERVRIRVIVRPDGTPDLTRLDIQGTIDEGYRRRLARALQHAAFIVARVDGCPVLTRVDVFITQVSD